MYEAYVKHFYYLKKGEMKMSNEFKAGDLVFELDFHGGVRIEVLKRKPHQDGDFHELSTRYGFNYSQCGRAYRSFKVPHLLHATPENRQALVTLYGEDAVPKLPVRGSELTMRLLEKQKYVLCLVSDASDDEARSSPYLVIVESYRGGFFDEVTNNSFYRFAVPIDNNGNEITEIEK